MEIRFFDGATAAALAQILPLLLLAVMVELRRTDLHGRGRNPVRTRVVLATFFGAFAVIETVMVISIDGHAWPTSWSDLVAAAIIFALLWLLFVLSMVHEKHEESHRRDR